MGYTTNYEGYDAQAYIEDASFRAWVWHQSEIATRFWEQYIREHPHKLPEINQAKAVVLGMSMVHESISVDDIENHIQATLEQIRQIPITPQSNEPVQPIPVRRFWPMRWVAAASLVLLLGVVWLLKTNILPNLLDRRQPADNGLAEHVNNSGHPLRLVLSDSSVVVLQPNSKLAYADTFEKTKREVYLTGEAQFDVSHHPERPFFVFAQTIVTKVLGTSFTIRAFADEKNVLVRVKTGRVSVFANPASGSAPGTSAEKTAILLTPNQQANYSKPDNELARSLVAKPEMLPTVTPGESFVYDEKPVVDVFEALERAYSVPIIYDEQKLANCLLTATLNNQSFYVKLDLICQTIGAHYEVVDGQVIVSGEGCR